MQSTRGLSGTLPPRKLKSERPTRKSVATAETSSKYAIEEIAAYIVIRDGLLAEAEKTTTCESLRGISSLGTSKMETSVRQPLSLSIA